MEYVKGGVPQGSKLGPIAFIVHINNLPAVKPKDLQPVLCDASNDQVIIDEGTALFMDDTPLLEAIDINTIFRVNKLVIRKAILTELYNSQRTNEWNSTLKRVKKC